MALFKTGTSSRVINRAVVILATLAALAASFNLPSGRVESLLPALAGRFMPALESSGSVAVVAIDSSTLDAYGTWPWPRDRLAEVIERLQHFSPAAIGVLLPLSGAETPAAVADMHEELDMLPAEHRAPAKTWLQQLDTDARLAEALKSTGNVVLAMPSRNGDSSMGAAREMVRFRLPVAASNLSWRQTLQRMLFAAPHVAGGDPDLPLTAFLDATTAGISEARTDNHHANSIRLAFEVDGSYLPGFELALLIAARPDTTPVVIPGAGVHLAQQDIIAPDLIYYPRPAGEVPVHSLKQLMRDDAAARQLSNKTLLLGVTAPALAPVLAGINGRQYSPVSWSAQALDSLLTGNAFIMPVWFHAVQRGLILLFALYLILLPSRWHEGRGPVISALLAFMSLNIGLLMSTAQFCPTGSMLSKSAGKMVRSSADFCAFEYLPVEMTCVSLAISRKPEVPNCVTLI